MVNRFYGLLGCVMCFFSASAQKADSAFIRKIYNEALENGHAYRRLGGLCKEVGHRLSGSENADKAVVWGERMLKGYGFDSVYLQPVMVPCWQRGDSEELYFKAPAFNADLEESKRINVFKTSYDCDAYFERDLNPNTEWFPGNGIALGGSVGTKGYLIAPLVIVNSDAQLISFGKEGLLQGKIVLLNRPFDQKFITTFSAYGACVGQRVTGASRAAKYGAVGVLVRSMTNACDMHAHTGVMAYNDSFAKIPAMAIPTAVADQLEIVVAMTNDNPKFSKAEVQIRMRLKSKILDDKPSYNVLAETKGKLYPKKIIVFGGHFDSWDQGEGAHDDGAGCMHAFEALRILKTLGYQPKHTLRCAWWMNEENGLRGAVEYATLCKANGESHVAALESDRGGFTPRGFTVDSAFMVKLEKYKPMLSAYGLNEWTKGGGGADIGPLKRQDANTVLLGFVPDSQRYFDVHHAKTDVFESVNKRELHLGAAAIAAMIVILDQELE